MAIKSKVKNIFLVILLVVVSTVLSAVKLFSGYGVGKINQAQAQSCWTPPPGGGGGGGGGGCSCGGFGCGGRGTGCACSSGCSSCSGCGGGCAGCA